MDRLFWMQLLFGLTAVGTAVAGYVRGAPYGLVSPRRDEQQGSFWFVIVFQVSVGFMLVGGAIVHFVRQL